MCDSQNCANEVEVCDCEEEGSDVEDSEGGE